MITIYTDGSSDGGVGDAGYGWVMFVNDEIHYAGYGALKFSTNNLAELQGAISALEYLIEHPIPGEYNVTLWSDSQYVIGIANRTYKPHKNLETAMKLKTYVTLLGVNPQWVRGHNGNEFNEIADELASMGKRGFFKHPKQKQLEKKKRKEMRK